MSTKKSYMSLLKEAIAEFDTSDNLEVKGPMLDPILSWDGGGELPIYKDAASILERYYFNENNDKGVNVMDEGSELEASSQNDKGSASGEAMKHTKGTGTEQAGTSDAATVLASKDEKAKDIAKEEVQVEQDKEEKDEEKEEDSEDLKMENSIIEKLIAEMEDEEKDEDKDEEKEVKEAEVMNYTGDGPKTEAPKEKKASGPEEDTKGAGTNQAGTGGDEKQLPDRKDKHNTAVDPKKYTDENAMIEAALAELEEEISEQDAPPAEPEVPDEEEEKELDVDKEMTKEQAPPPAPSAVPGGPAPDKEDEDEDVYEEAFKLFKEAITEEDEKDEKAEEKEEEKDE